MPIRPNKANVQLGTVLPKATQQLVGFVLDTLWHPSTDPLSNKAERH
jgi:hypothetical protein